MRRDRRLPPAGGARRPEAGSLLSGGTCQEWASSRLSRSKAWCGVIGAAPQATACATTSGSARISSQPRRSSTSGGLRCSRRSRLSRRQNVTEPVVAHAHRVGEQAAGPAAPHHLLREQPLRDDVRRPADAPAHRADPAVAGDVVDRDVGGTVAAEPFEGVERVLAGPGRRVVPVDDVLARGDLEPRQRRVVAVLVEVVQVHDRHARAPPPAGGRAGTCPTPRGRRRRPPGRAPRRGRARPRRWFAHRAGSDADRVPDRLGLQERRHPLQARLDGPVGLGVGGAQHPLEVLGRAPARARSRSRGRPRGR